MRIEKSEVLHTPFGNAKLDFHGYYVITSKKEKNYGKKLHRLLYEAYHKIKLPKEIIVHHKNENRSDNCILNLEAVTREEHNKIHFKDKKLNFNGRKHSEETKEKIRQSHIGKKISLEGRINMSKHQNSTGYYRVYKQKDETCRQGFRWCYNYKVNGKRKQIKSVDIKKLEQKVKAKGLDWIKFED